MKNDIINTNEATNSNNMTEKENATMTTKRTYNRVTSIKCIETGKIFSSVPEAAKEMNLCANSIYHVLKGNRSRVGGYHFEYADKNKDTEETPIEPKPEIVAPISPDTPKEIIVQHKAVVKGKGKRMNGNTKSVFNFSTGAFYTSATDTAEHIGTSQSNVSFACRNKGRTVKGQKVCYVRDIPEHLDEIGNAIRKANMYDEFQTKEEKRKEMIEHLKDLEDSKKGLVNEINNLTECCKDIDKEIESIKHELIFGF